MTQELKVYHGTSFENLASILKEGVRPPSFWTYEHQARLTYAGCEEMRGWGGAVIAVSVSGRIWHEVDKKTSDFRPILGTDEDVYGCMEWNGVGIVCLDHLNPGDIEVVHMSEPAPRKVKHRVKRE